MRYQRLSAVISAFAISIASLLTITFSGVAHAAPGQTLWWCGGTDLTFATPQNWATSSTCAGNTNTTAYPDSDSLDDSLVFDSTNISTDTTLTNNINFPPLALNSITFQNSGTNSFGYILEGNGITLDSGILDSGTEANSIGFDTLAITASQSFSVAANGSLLVEVGAIGGGSLTLGANTLTLDASAANATMEVNAQMSGNSGTVDMEGPVSVNSSAEGLSFDQLPNGFFQFGGTNNFEQGTIEMSDNNLSTGSNVVSSGATLLIGTPNSGTINEPLTLAGTGNGALGALDGVGAGNLTLSGTVTLTANTTIDTDSTITITGPLTGNFSLGLAPGATGTLVIDSSLNSSATPNGTIVNPSGTGSSSSGGSSTTPAPKTPDTGVGLVMVNVMLPLIGSFAVAGGLYFISRKIKRPSTKSS